MTLLSWTVVSDSTSAIELIAALGCLMIGLSHIVRPQVWQDYFASLHKQGDAGVFTRTMTWELWPALILVTCHQVWHGPGIVLTIFGWLLFVKCAVSLLVPRLSLSSIEIGQRNAGAFVWAGAVLISVAIASGLALVWR